MPYPEIVNIPLKENAIPFTDPSTQFSADELNDLVDKHNKNALFYGVHANVNTLISKHPNPKIGATALLTDGTEYRSTTGVWITRDQSINQNNKRIVRRLLLKSPLNNVNEFGIISDQLNKLPNFTIQEDETVLFYVYQGSVDRGIYRIDYEVTKGKGLYGESGSVLQASDINKTAVKFLKDDVLNGFNNLNDIGSSSIFDYVNANGPYGIEGDRFFKAIISGEEKIYLYTGGAGIIGNGNTQTASDDFEDIYVSSMNAILINIKSKGGFATEQYVNQGDTNVLNYIASRLGTWTYIDGFLVNKRSNPNYEAIEIGDFIKGDFGPVGNETTRVIEANVAGLPYTDENNLQILESNRTL